MAITTTKQGKAHLAKTREAHKKRRAKVLEKREEAKAKVKAKGTK